MIGIMTTRRVLGVQATGQRCVRPCCNALGRLSVQKRHVLVYTSLRQDKMTVLQYADAFESRLAQIGNYDESYYLIHFIFGLRPEIMRGVYLQQPASILAAKEMAEKLELTHQCTASHPDAY